MLNFYPIASFIFIATADAIYNSSAPCIHHFGVSYYTYLKHLAILVGWACFVYCCRHFFNFIIPANFIVMV